MDVYYFWFFTFYTTSQICGLYLWKERSVNITHYPSFSLKLHIMNRIGNNQVAVIKKWPSSAYNQNKKHILRLMSLALSLRSLLFSCGNLRACLYAHKLFLRANEKYARYCSNIIIHPPNERTKTAFAFTQTECNSSPHHSQY